MGTTLDDNERELMRHALGLNYQPKPFRNHFCASPGHSDWDAWKGLVAKGLATRRKPHPLSGGDYIFHVTEAGEAAL